MFPILGGGRWWNGEKLLLAGNFVLSDFDMLCAVAAYWVGLWNGEKLLAAENFVLSDFDVYVVAAYWVG
jgi:hypothetical protein